MPPRKSNVSATSNGPEEGMMEAKTTKERDGLSVDDLSLPKSMIARLAKGVLPANTQIQKDALLALHKSATVFVSYIASNSGENAQAAGKKTIMPLDVMSALKDTEFEGFLPRLEAELKKYNDTQCDKRNTYRRKVKEEKAAAAPTTGEEGKEEGADANHGGSNSEILEDSIVTANGHTNGDSSIMTMDDDADAERPVKKLKAVNGSAAVPSRAEDEDGEEEESEDDDEDDVEEDDEEEEEEEEGDEDGDEVDDQDDGVEESQISGASHLYAHDDTLDDNDSD